jgi:hypothetical protein
MTKQRETIPIGREKNFELQEKEPGIPGDKAAYGLDGRGELVFDSMT